MDQGQRIVGLVGHQLIIESQRLAEAAVLEGEVSEQFEGVVSPGAAKARSTTRWSRPGSRRRSLAEPALREPIVHLDTALAPPAADARAIGGRSGGYRDSGQIRPTDPRRAHLRDLRRPYRRAIDDLLVDIDRFGCTDDPWRARPPSGASPLNRSSRGRIWRRSDPDSGPEHGPRRERGQEADQPEDDPGWLISAPSSGSADPT